MRPGRIVMLVLGTLSALLGLGLLAAAGAAGFANYLQRDNGYFTTPSERYATNSYALTSPRLDIMADEGVPDTSPVGVVGSVMLGGSAAAGKEIFIGIGPAGRRGGLSGGRQPLRDRGGQFNPFRVDLPGRGRHPGSGEACGPAVLGRVRQRPGGATARMGPAVRQLGRGDHERRRQCPGGRGHEGRSPLRPAVASLRRAADRRNRVPAHWRSPDRAGGRRAGPGQGRTAPQPGQPQPQPGQLQPSSAAAAAPALCGRAPCRARRQVLLRDPAGCRRRLSGPSQRLPGPEPVALEVAGEVAPGDPALHRPLFPLVCLRRGHHRRVVRDPVYRALPALAVQLQCRGDPLELACGLLLVRGTRHGRLSALHPGAHRLPGRLRRRLSRESSPAAWFS